MQFFMLRIRPRMCQGVAMDRRIAD